MKKKIVFTEFVKICDELAPSQICPLLCVGLWQHVMLLHSPNLPNQHLEMREKKYAVIFSIWLHSGLNPA